MFCKNCGVKLDDSVKFCPSCGSATGASTPAAAPAPTPVPPPAYGAAPGYTPHAAPGYAPAPAPAPATKKSKIAAALLAFFLGGFGAHNFYLGHTGKAVAQLLITVLTCGIGSFAVGIWAFIEFILILMGNIKDSRGLDLE